MLDLAVAIPTLIGSYLSMFAAGAVAICYLVLPSQRHFRHTLIINLAAADFFNALNNSISGTYAMIYRDIPRGAACSLNGTIGQVTVQATDFSILFMTVATVLTLRRWNYKPEIRRTTKILITCGIWLVPLATSLTALSLNAYKPVSGSWCWLNPKRTLLRYTLGHGWRLCIIVTILALYAYLFTYIHRHFSSLRALSVHSPKSNTNFNADTSYRTEHWSHSTVAANVEGEIVIHEEFEIYDEPFDAHWDTQIPAQEINYFLHGRPLSDHQRKIPPQRLRILSSQPVHDSTCLHKTRDPLAIVRRPAPYQISATIESLPAAQETLWKREKQIHKLLLLNAYPFAYVLFWLPGIANRAVELSGHQSRTLAILQASTQFVGLANALVYGYNEHIYALSKLWWQKKKANGFKPDVREEKITTHRVQRSESLSFEVEAPQPRLFISKPIPFKVSVVPKDYYIRRFDKPLPPHPDPWVNGKGGC